MMNDGCDDDTDDNDDDDGQTDIKKKKWNEKLKRQHAGQEV